VVSAALYECVVRHTRTEPVRNDFTYRTYQWLVDIDDVPRLPWPLRLLADFRAADHFGDRDASIRRNVDAFLAERGVDLHGGRVLMLANARVLGYVFNPLTLFWCHDRDGDLACVIAEVHNTYGQRHAYLLATDEHGRAAAAKAFYVSPFYAVEGGVYCMRLPEPDERLAVSIRLDLPGRAPFVAGLRGRRRPGTPANLMRASLRYPLATLAVSARIRWQGVRLYLRGVPVVPRPKRDEYHHADGDDEYCHADSLSLRHPHP
jgi:hypothetical protein